MLARARRELYQAVISRGRSECARMNRAHWLELLQLQSRLEETQSMPRSRTRSAGSKPGLARSSCPSAWPGSAHHQFDELRRNPAIPSGPGLYFPEIWSAVGEDFGNCNGSS